MEQEQEKKEKIKTLIIVNKFRKLLFLLTMAVILTLGYFSVISGNWSSAKEKKSDLTNIKAAELENAENYFSKLKELEEVIKNFKRDYSTEIEKLYEILPAGAQVPELILQIEAIVERNGFALADLSVTEKELQPASKSETNTNAPDSVSRELAFGSFLPDNLGIISFPLTVGGSDYFTFKNLLNDLERHIRIFDITSLTIRGGAEAGYSFNIQTYYLKENYAADGQD